MIEFSCGQCGKAFRVPEAYAGKSAKCKACGFTVKVPVPVIEEPVVPAERVPMRTRRLRADADAMNAAFHGFEIIRVVPLAGDPPEAYQVDFAVDSLERGPDGKPVPRREHRIEIQLTSEYPRLAPKCKMVTPVFHPNIDPASICVGDHWTAGERLVDLVIRIGEMLAYQAYNVQSPLDGEAAMWADLNRGLLPTDPREMRPAGWE
jgi:ubiquitin-protein ligase/DNA-directed RNA polymerase subunit RPC12/RpoP